MKNNFKVCYSTTMSDGKTTCVYVSVMNKNTGEVYESIGVAKLNPSDKYDSRIGQQVGFYRGYKKSLLKIKKDLVKEYSSLVKQLENQAKLIGEIENKLANLENDYDYDE